MTETMTVMEHYYGVDKLSCTDVGDGAPYDGESPRKSRIDSEAKKVYQLENLNLF